MSPSDTRGHRCDAATQTTAFYDGLAADYHLIYGDWEAASQRQAAVLDEVIRAHTGREPPLRVLDCSCGIGTQALGLAARGYRVTAADLSPQAVDRCAREAAHRGLPVDAAVVDMRHLGAHRFEAASFEPASFDVVLSCDNAVPHLLESTDLAQAFAGMHAQLADGGLVLIGLRDYDRLRQERPTTTPVRVLNGGERLVFQVWDWDEDGERYGFRHFLVRRDGDGWRTDCGEARYRAWTQAQLTAALQGAGFGGVRWALPADSGYVEKLASARRQGTWPSATHCAA